MFRLVWLILELPMSTDRILSELETVLQAPQEDLPGRPSAVAGAGRGRKRGGLFNSSGKGNGKGKRRRLIPPATVMFSASMGSSFNLECTGRPAFLYKSFIAARAPYQFSKSFISFLIHILPECHATVRLSMDYLRHTAWLRPQQADRRCSTTWSMSGRNCTSIITTFHC